MKNISYHGQLELSSSGITDDVVEFGGLGRPQISIESDGTYEIYASVDNPGKLIKMFSERTLTGDNMIAWDFVTNNAVKYLEIKLISGTYLKADIRVLTRMSIN